MFLRRFTHRAGRLIPRQRQRNNEYADKCDDYLQWVESDIRVLDRLKCH